MVMQPQGLQALMPQQGPAPTQPPMDRTRMAAAMDVVTSDAEEQILDPRTLAALKYKDAVEAMKSADQLMAASRPMPMPPTVAERTKMAAEEGIRGLAQRLAPGMQNRGRQVQAAQARQMLGGGLPTQAAPNMARMAGGGIVGYAEGGPAQSAMLTETQQYLNAQRTLNDPNASQQEKVSAQGVLDSLRPVQQGGNVDPNIYAQMRQQLEKIRAARAGEKTDTEARGFQDGGNVGIGRAYIDPETGEPLSRADRLAKLLGFDRSQQSTGGQMSRTRGRPTIERGEAEEPAARPTETGEVSRAGILDSLLRPRIPADPNFRMQGVRDVPPSTAEPTTPPSTSERLAGSIEDLIAMINEPRDTTPSPIDSRLEALREPTITAVTERMAPGYEQRVREQIQEEAGRAYAIPQEYRDLIEARKKELETPLYTPEEARSRKIDALLAGMASSNLIAQSGPRAAAAVNAVTDAIKRDELDRANRSFELSADLMNKDMEGARAAFGEGLKVMNTAMNQVSVATQMAGSMLNQADNTAAARDLQDRQERLSRITSTISALSTLGQLEKADRDSLISVASGATRELDSIQRNISALTEALAVADEEVRGPIQIQIDALKAQEALAISALRAARSSLGFETGGGTEQSLVGDVIDYTSL